MIRIATKADIPHVAATYCELLTYEQEHGTHSNWVLDVYPTEETAETAFQKNYLYVLEEEGTICGSVILNQLQPEEYTAGTWHYEAILSVFPPVRLARATAAGWYSMPLRWHRNESCRSSGSIRGREINRQPHCIRTWGFSLPAELTFCCKD